MVAHPGTTVGTHGLRPLGLPKHVTVEVDDLGLPRAVLRGDHPVAVAVLEEVWRVAEAWWREAPQARTYYRVILQGGRPLTLFRDEATGAWSEQPYSTPSHGDRP